MDKLVATIVIIGLVLVVYFSVFQNGLSPTVVNKGTSVENIINGSNP